MKAGRRERWVGLGHIFAVALAAVLTGAAPAAAQELERYAISEDDVAIYNLAGTLRVEPATGSSVVVEVRRGGEDADQLRVETHRLDGRPVFAVVYPDNHIVYSELGHRSRTQLRVREDGTFFGGSRSGRTVSITGSGRGLDAHADLRVLVPKGATVSVYLAVGAAVVSNVDGRLSVNVGSASIRSERTRGSLRLDTGSGSVAVHGAEGEVEVDTGSGRVEVNQVTGSRLNVDTGSGSVTGSAIAVERLEVDTGSGRIELSDVHAPNIELDTGSGRVELGLLAEPRRLVIDTGSGSVRLSIPATTSAELEIDTGSGGIDVDLPVTVMRRQRSYFFGRLGSGEGSIKIDTGSGGVRVTGTRVTGT